MQFRPVLDRAACTDFKLLKSDQHQVFGTFTGTAVLDDGSALSVRDFFGFAEKVEKQVVTESLAEFCGRRRIAFGS